MYPPCFCGEVILDIIARIIGMVNIPQAPTTATVELAKTY